MSRPTIPVCDQCGKLKGPSNRWFIAVEANLPAYPGATRPLHGLSVFPATMQESGYDFENVIDLCGESCAQKALAQWMQKQKA
jgi:hypothetical protein